MDGPLVDVSVPNILTNSAELMHSVETGVGTHEFQWYIYMRRFCALLATTTEFPKHSFIVVMRFYFYFYQESCPAQTFSWCLIAGWVQRISSAISVFSHWPRWNIRNADKHCYKCHFIVQSWGRNTSDSCLCQVFALFPLKFRCLNFYTTIASRPRITTSQLEAIVHSRIACAVMA